MFFGIVLLFPTHINTGGAFWEFLICLFLGFIVGLLSLAAEKFEFMSRLFEALAGTIFFFLLRSHDAATLVSFTARLISAYFPYQTCFFSMALSAGIQLEKNGM